MFKELTRGFTPTNDVNHNFTLKKKRKKKGGGNSGGATREKSQETSRKSRLKEVLKD